MTQPSSRILAKQGDPEAIAALMNATLQPRGITATAEVRQGNLHIFFTSDRPLPQPALIDFTQKGLVKLGVDAFPAVWIYAYPTGEDLPLWIESVPLQTEEIEDAAVAAAEKSPDAIAGPEVRPRLWMQASKRRPWLWVGLLAAVSFAGGGLSAWFTQTHRWPHADVSTSTASTGVAADWPTATPMPTLGTTFTPAEQQTQAKTYLAKMNQAQQAFYAQNNRLAASLEELERSAAVMAHSYAYSYKLTVRAPNQVDLTGIPLAEGLKSFRAIAWVPASPVTTPATRVALCESNAPSKNPPALPKTEDTIGQCPPDATLTVGP